MYDVANFLPGGTVSELGLGRSLLIAGPALSGKQNLALDLLAVGLDEGDGVLVVTTDENASKCVEDLKRRVPSFDRDQVGVVDCSGSAQQNVIREIATQRVSSPGDLTGISIGTAKLMQQFTTQDISRVRHGLVSVSTLLQYLEPQTVFKFLHIYTTRIADTQGLGLFTVDNAAHDAQTLNTFMGEFDGVIELRETEAGEQEIRVKGLTDVPREWHPW